LCGFEDPGSLGDAPAVDHFHDSTEVIDGSRLEVAEVGTLPGRTANAGALVEPVLRQGDERGAGAVADDLLGVRATQDQKPEVGVGNDVLDQVLDPEVLGLERARNAHLRTGRAMDVGGEVCIGEGATATGGWKRRTVYEPGNDGQPSRTGAASVGQVTISSRPSGSDA
jgi:hypothetical protein